MTKPAIKAPTIKATILVLCSDPGMLSVLKNTLEEDGYVVLPARDLGSAVSRLDKCTPHLLLVRPWIDSISGHQAAVYLRTKCHGLKVLIAGGFLDDDRLLSREALRDFEIFPDAYAAAQLLEKVRAVLHQAE